MGVVSGQIQYSSTFQKSIVGVPVTPGSTAAPTVPEALSSKFTLGNGTAADQCDLEYFATLTFVASTPQVLDLTALVDPVVGTLNMKRVASIEITMRGLVDGVTLKLGYSGVTTNAWTSLVSNPGQITLQAAPTATNSAYFVLAAPGATGYVTGTTNKLLNLDPGTAAFSIDIRITGRSV